VPAAPSVQPGDASVNTTLAVTTGTEPVAGESIEIDGERYVVRDRLVAVLGRSAGANLAYGGMKPTPLLGLKVPLTSGPSS